MRLHHFDIVGNAGDEAVARLVERLAGQIDIAFCHFHLFGGGLQIENRVAHVLIDLPAQIFELIAVVGQRRVGFQRVRMDFPALENGNFQRALRFKCSVQM